MRRLDRLAFAVLWTSTLLSWVILYFVSFGPVVAIAQKVGIESSFLKPFYMPVIWLHDYTPLEKPLEAYANAWGWH